MPSSSIIGGLGLSSFPMISSSPSFPPLMSQTVPLPAASITTTLSSGRPTTITTLAGVGSSPKTADTIVVAPGVPALKRSLVEQILDGKFVDLAELPPAKGFSKPPTALSSDVEGKIVLLQAADYVHSKKHIPDLATWIQCFAINSAVLLTRHPERAQSLLMYSATIARLSTKFQWPSWIIYGQYFCQEAADTGKTDWAKIDSSIYTQCMTLTDGWC